uniref:Uncharacterized protein n=1 Tax=viral metagenome TaxID=1070528 RepID=A0A6M3IKA0_9ZZZZ
MATDQPEIQCPECKECRGDKLTLERTLVVGVRIEYQYLCDTCGHLFQVMEPKPYTPYEILLTKGDCRTIDAMLGIKDR